VIDPENDESTEEEDMAALLGETHEPELDDDSDDSSAWVDDDDDAGEPHKESMEVTVARMDAQLKAQEKALEVANKRLTDGQDHIKNVEADNRELRGMSYAAAQQQQQYANQPPPAAAPPDQDPFHPDDPLEQEVVDRVKAYMKGSEQWNEAGQTETGFTRLCRQVKGEQWYRNRQREVGEFQSLRQHNDQLGQAVVGLNMQVQLLTLGDYEFMNALSTDPETQAELLPLLHSGTMGVKQVRDLWKSKQPVPAAAPDPQADPPPPPDRGSPSKGGGKPTRQSAGKQNVAAAMAYAKKWGIPQDAMKAASAVEKRHESNRRDVR